MADSPNLPTPEERTWAVLSHLSALAFGMGLPIPLVAWNDQRRKSNYASFQALQAYGYQSLGFTLWFLVYLLAAIVLVVVFLIIAAVLSPTGRPVDDTIAFIWMSVFMAVVFGIFGFYLLFPVIAAIACGLGRDFRYPILGARLEHYLAYDPTDPKGESSWLDDAHSERWVASMGHFAVIIMIWGTLGPLSAWIFRGKESTFLRWQSIQTVIYQVLGMIAYFVAVFLSMTSLFPAAMVFAVPNLGQEVALAALVISFAGMCIFALIMLLLPLYHLLGQWAGYRVLKGDDYGYPLLGKLVQKKLKITQTVG